MPEDLVLFGKSHPIAGFSVFRSLPQRKRRHVGPFVFLDHMGPQLLDTHQALDVAPHPHIGLATVTYLFEGTSLHKDSLGHVQQIMPGDLNWMVAGSGIVHSERSPQTERNQNPKKSLHGVQVWVALPVDFEKKPANFTHYPKTQLPELVFDNQMIGRLLLGEYQDRQSPVATLSPTLLIELKTIQSGQWQLQFDAEEVGIFVVQGQVRINQKSAAPESLIIVHDPCAIDLACTEDAHMMILGGSPMPEERYMWWNFVASDKRLIYQAAEKWQQQQMGHVPDETTYVPLPKGKMP